MALDIKPTRSELINLKRRIKQTSSGYNLLKMKRDGLFHEFRTLLSEMISAREDLVGTLQGCASGNQLSIFNRGRAFSQECGYSSIQETRSQCFSQEYYGSRGTEGGR